MYIKRKLHVRDDPSLIDDWIASTICLKKIKSSGQPAIQQLCFPFLRHGSSIDVVLFAWKTDNLRQLCLEACCVNGKPWKKTKPQWRIIGIIYLAFMLLPTARSCKRLTQRLIPYATVHSAGVGRKLIYSVALDFLFFEQKNINCHCVTFSFAECVCNTDFPASKKKIALVHGAVKQPQPLGCKRQTQGQCQTDLGPVVFGQNAFV